MGKKAIYPQSLQPQLRFGLQETAGDGGLMSVYFRVFDNSVGFRYEIPEQEGFKDFINMDEVIGFAMTDDHSVKTF